jgi:hypothetical protein
MRREVTGPLRCRGGNAAIDERRCPNAQSLIRPEYKRLVSHHWASRCRAELVLVQSGYGGLEEITRVQIVVSQKLEQRAMQIVRACPRDDINDSTRKPPELGIEITRQQTEFLYRVRVGGLIAPVAKKAVVRAAIQQKTGLSKPAAVHADEVPLVVSDRKRSGAGDARENRYQRVHVAPIER